jgi:hypothetical protein
MANIIITKFVQEGLDEYKTELTSTINQVDKLSKSEQSLNNEFKKTSATTVSVTKNTTENTTATKQASASIEALAKAEKELQKAQTIVATSTDGLTKKQVELREKINSTAGILQKLNSTGNTSGSLFTSLTSKLTLLTTEFQNEAKAVTTATVKQQSMRSEIKQSREEIARLLATGKLTTAQIYNMSKSAGNLKDAFSDASGAINVLSSDTFALDATIQTVQSLASGFQVLQGVQALVGSENEDLQKTLVKLNGVMAITQGLQQIQNALQKNSAQSLGLMTLAQSTYTAVVGTSTGAMKLFRIALASTGIGLLIVLIGSLVANWKSLTSSIDSNNKYLVNFRNNIAGIKDIIRGTVGSALTFLKTSFVAIGQTLATLLFPSPSNIQKSKDAWAKAGTETSKAYRDAILKGDIKDAQIKLIESSKKRAELLGKEADLEESVGNERIALQKRLQSKNDLLIAARLEKQKGDLKDTIEAQIEYNNAVKDLNDYDLKLKEDAQKKADEIEKNRKETQKNNLEDEISRIKANIIERENVGKATYDLQVKLIKKEAELALLSAKGAGSRAEIEATKNKKILDLSKSFETEYQKIIEDGNKARRELGMNDFDLEISRINSESDAKVKALQDNQAKELLASQNAGNGNTKDASIISSFKAQIDGVNEARNKSLFEADLKYFNTYFKNLEDYQAKILEKSKFTNDQLVTNENERYLLELTALNDKNLSSQDKLKEREEIEKRHKAELLAIEIKSQNDLFAIELDGARKRLAVVEQQYKDEVDTQGKASDETIKKKEDLTTFINEASKKQKDNAVKVGIDAAGKEIQTEQQKKDEINKIREDRTNFAIALEDKLYSFTNLLINTQQQNLDNQLKKGLISQKEYDKKTAELKRKQAIADKANAAFKIGINTATGITSALTLPPPLSFILAGVTAALGLAELAVVLSTPIPQFKKGGLTDKIFKGSGYVKGASHENGGVNANLEGNEFVMQQTAVNKYGKETFDKLNKGLLNPDIFAVPSVNYSKINKEKSNIIVNDYRNLEKLMNENNDLLYKLTIQNERVTVNKTSRDNGIYS